MQAEKPNIRGWQPVRGPMLPQCTAVKWREAGGLYGRGGSQGATLPKTSSSVGNGSASGRHTGILVNNLITS